MSTLLSSRTRLLGPLALAIALALTLLPSAALAAKPEHFHINYDETFPGDNICGIDVTTHIKGVSNEIVYVDNDGNFVAFKATGRGVNTFTAENGKSVSVEFAGQFHSTFVDNGDGTITFIDTYKGLPEKIVGESGGPLLRDAGLISFITIVDFSVDPPVVVSFEVVHGPHPEADSDFTLFCEVITAALS
jgi:hypothetical protein